MFANRSSVAEVGDLLEKCKKIASLMKGNPLWIIQIQDIPAKVIQQEEFNREK